MTIKQALINAQKKLKDINSAHLDAEILLSHILNKQREFVLSHPEIEINDKQIDKYDELIKKRAKHEPTAYLTGHKEFYGLDFKINKDVLIPRPETELIIDNVLQQKTNPDTIIDIGTGSGCIIIALAKHLKIKAIAVDISDKALEIARQNAKKHNVNIQFIQGDLLQPILNNPGLINKCEKLIITANLPYLKPNYSNMLKHEPELALKGGSDGLDCYRKLAEQIKKLKNSSVIYCEIDHLQADAIKEIFNFAKIQIKSDLAGLDRLAVIEI
ncbi:MAG: peptide chain release factor N(5)-glutamine methyltransferase [bacterium]